jgi:ornithine cyclodeaminase/alanine dehydrogenase-like protein (mu-crystallin family)
MAHATLECLCSLFDRPHDIWLMRYKDQAERFAAQYADSPHVCFHLTDSREELIGQTQALYSCVTVMNEQFLSPSAYPQGYTLIPVHTRGFQDCDVVFDRIFGDDTEHLRCFQHFNEFKAFAEFSDVLLGRAPGRQSADERIISYNIGLGLHDVWFASHIYDRIRG